jgi:hypothetical protein
VFEQGLEAWVGVKLVVDGFGGQELEAVAVVFEPVLEEPARRGHAVAAELALGRLHRVERLSTSVGEVSTPGFRLAPLPTQR